MKFTTNTTTLIAGLIASVVSTSFAKPKKFDEVNEGYTKVISTVDGATPLFGLWKNAKEEQSIVVRAIALSLINSPSTRACGARLFPFPLHSPCARLSRGSF